MRGGERREKERENTEKDNKYERRSHQRGPVTDAGGEGRGGRDREGMQRGYDLIVRSLFARVGGGARWSMFVSLPLDPPHHRYRRTCHTSFLSDCARRRRATPTLTLTDQPRPE